MEPGAGVSQVPPVPPKVVLQPRLEKQLDEMRQQLDQLRKSLDELRAQRSTPKADEKK